MQTVQDFLQCTSERTNITWPPQEINADMDSFFISDGVMTHHYQYNSHQKAHVYHGSIYKMSVLLKLEGNVPTPIKWGCSAEIYRCIGSKKESSLYTIIDITSFDDTHKTQIVNDFTTSSWKSVMSNYSITDTGNL